MLSTTVTLDGTQVDKVEVTRPHSDIALNAPQSTTVHVGASFDPRDGLSVSDSCHVAQPEDVSIIGEVDTSKPGTYELKYRILGRGGSYAEAARTITVAATEEQSGDDTADEQNEQKKPRSWVLLAGILGALGISGFLEVLFSASAFFGLG